MTFQVSVPGIPKPQLRGRAFIYKRGDKTRVGMYDPTSSHDWKGAVNRYVASYAAGLGFSPLVGPVALRLDFAMPRPKSLPKRVLFHVKKPDVDNLAKAVKDAIKGVVYLDDSQVTQLTLTKYYSEEPGVHIEARGGENGQR